MGLGLGLGLARLRITCPTVPSGAPCAASHLVRGENLGLGLASAPASGEGWGLGLGLDLGQGWSELRPHRTATHSLAHQAWVRGDN